MILYSNYILIKKKSGGYCMERVIWQELWPSVENSVERKLGKSTPQSHFSPVCPPVPCLHLMSAKPKCQPKSRAPIGAVQAGQSTRSQSRAEEGGGRGWGHTEAISSPWPRVQTNRRKGKSVRPTPHGKLVEFTQCPALSKPDVAKNLTH